MSLESRCPACHHPFGDDWQLLSPTACFDEAVATHLCPRCTLGRTGQHWIGDDITATYRARVCEGMDPLGLWEDENGRIKPPGRVERGAITRSRLTDLAYAIKLAGQPAPARVLHVGAREGNFLRAASKTLGVNAVGLEPWIPWMEKATAAGIEAHPVTLERFGNRRKFDIVVEHGLAQHLHDPAVHLEHVRKSLTPNGVAVIEVPNLVAGVGYLSTHFLRANTPVVFTPRGLATLCQRVGLTPIQMAAQNRLRVFCRIGPPKCSVFPGPDANTVAAAAWGNDLRLSVKQALAKRGVTPVVLRTAARVHRRCPTAATRADIAIEIAVACERCSDYERAAYWMRRSLEDRADTEVERTLEQLEQLSRRVTSAWTGTEDLVAANDDEQLPPGVFPELMAS